MRLFSRNKKSEANPPTPAPSAPAPANPTSTDSSSANPTTETKPPPAPATAAFPVGIKVWVDCKDATVDICFIHGLTGDRDKTWTYKGNADPWPKTLIPEALADLAKLRGVDKTPRARILTYGYDAYVVKMQVSSQNGLRDHAGHFLDQIVTDREAILADGRPLILVAHSLGGLVAKKAILMSRDNPDAHLQDLYKSLRGIAFMGVPHRGSWMADWSTIPVSVFGIVKSTNTTMLKILKSDDPLLWDTQKEFLLMVRKDNQDGPKFDMTCYFEELPLVVLGKRVVSPTSATLDGYKEVSIHANHSDMVKFDSKEDPAFKSLFMGLVRWGKESVDQSLVPACMKSLAFPEMGSRMKNVTVAADKTLAWLSTHPMYDAWANNNDGVLWIRGKPGSGKSTIMRHIVDRTKKLLANDKQVLILSFFFHGRGTTLQKSPLGLYRSLLHQLLEAAPDSLIHLIGTYKRNENTKGECGKGWNWEQNELSDFLEGALQEVSRTLSVWLFIDALDEVGKKDAVELIRRSKLLIQGLPISAKFRFCFSSRHYPVLAQDFNVNICLEDENLGDISEFVKTELSIFRTDPIPDLIIQRSGGIFMWARLTTERVLELSLEGKDQTEIEAHIKGVPPDLNDLYAEILHKLKDEEVSIQLFDWVCFAKRPLTPEELLTTIGAKISQQLIESRDDKESIGAGDVSKMQRQIGSLSGGLAELVATKDRNEEQTTVVQFIHQSVQDFYVTKGLAVLHHSPPDTTISQLVGEAHDRLLKACIGCTPPDTKLRRQIREHHTFLSSNWNDMDEWWRTRYTSMKGNFPPLTYAVSAWPYHARESQERGLSLDYLLGEEYLDWPSAHREQSLSRSRSDVGPSSRAVSILHVLAGEGLVGPLRVLIRKARNESDIYIDMKDIEGATPLTMAVQYGRTDVVKLFVDETTSASTGIWTRINSQMIPLNSPQVDFSVSLNNGILLGYAAASGYRAIVRLLVNSGRIDVNQQDHDGWTALKYAFLRHRYDIMQDLLDCEQVDPNVGKGSLLRWAIERKDHTALEVLLKSGKVDVNQSTYDSLIGNAPPLTYAAKQQNWYAVQALIETGKVRDGLKRPWMQPLGLFNQCPSAARVLMEWHKIELLTKLRDAKVDGQAPSEEEKLSRMEGAIGEVLDDVTATEVRQLAEELMGDDVAGARIWGMNFSEKLGIYSLLGLI